MVLIQLPTPHGTFRVEAAVGEGAEDLRGFEVSEDSKVRRIFERRRRENVPSLLDDPEVDQVTARRFGAHAALYVPLLARDEAIGVMVAFDKHGATGAFDEDDVRLGEAKDQEARERAATELRELVVQTLQDVRRLAVELRPTALDDFGLRPALERLTSTFAEQTGTVVEIESQLGEERLPADVETVLYRIVQEALTNVVKHA